MRWRQERRSTNIEDRRARRVPTGRTAGVGVGGCGLIALVIIAVLMGVDPTPLLEGGAGGGAAVEAPEEYAPSAEEQQMSAFVSAVLADTEDTWDRVFDESVGQDYQEPTLVLFSGQVRSACGIAGAAVGPFYCPGDRKVYLDLTFFDELERRFGAPGDFAQAYVISHEIGHHVQTLLGITQQVEQIRRRSSRTEANAMSVRLELQADCLAGVWANQAQRRNLILDTDDLEEGLNAASAIGDDRLQKQAQGYVVPDAFTHGSSAQRVEWFKRGLASGDISVCDTFGGR